MKVFLQNETDDPDADPTVEQIAHILAFDSEMEVTWDEEL